jgi:hypothetical protein
MALIALVTRQRLVRAGTLSASVLLLAALLAMVNYFGWKYHKRFDWTQSRLYSLSDRSKNVIRDLKRDVEFVVFLEPQQELYQQVRDLLSQYDSSPRIHVRYVDAAKNPAEAQALVRKYEVSSTGVVVVSGNDRRAIDSNDLAEMDYSGLQTGQGPQMTGFKGEQAFTGALIQLSEGRKPKVLFTTGHGELSLDGQDARGLSSVQQILGRDNFDLQEWTSIGQPSIPAGTDLVVIAGPTGTFLPPELAAFARYLDGGGRMLVLVDPRLGQAPGSGLTPTGLESWLAGYGVKVGNDIVVDPPSTIPSFGAETIFAKDYGDHPITRPLAQGNLPVLVSLVRSVGKGQESGVNVTELVRTSGQGWGETDLAHLEKVDHDAADVGGPVPLGVAVEADRGNNKMRLVVFGDSDFATNQLVQGNAPNAILLSNALNWLVEREALLAIPSKKTEQVRLNLTGAQFRTVYLIALALLPGLAIVAGSLVYVRRRR